MQAIPERDRQFARRAAFIKSDRLANVIDNDLTRVAIRHVPVELFADRRVDRAIHVIIQVAHEFFALHCNG